MDVCEPIFKIKKKKSKNKNKSKSTIIELIPIEIDESVYLFNLETQFLYEITGKLLGVYNILC